MRQVFKNKLARDATSLQAVAKEMTPVWPGLVRLDMYKGEPISDLVSAAHQRLR
jgi:hypothetical protein